MRNSGCIVAASMLLNDEAAAKLTSIAASKPSSLAARQFGNRLKVRLAPASSRPPVNYLQLDSWAAVGETRPVSVTGHWKWPSSRRLPNRQRPCPSGEPKIAMTTAWIDHTEGTPVLSALAQRGKILVFPGKCRRLAEKG